MTRNDHSAGTDAGRLMKWPLRSDGPGRCGVRCRGGGRVHHRDPAMSDERSEPEPLDYARRSARGRTTRGAVVAFLGALVGSAGVAVFLLAHRLTGGDYDSLPAEHARLHESLWAALGIALLLAGALVAAVG